MSYDPNNYNSGYQQQPQQPYPYGQPGQYGQSNQYGQPNPYVPQYAYPGGYGYQQPAGPPTNSGIGVASFIISLIAAASLLVLIVIAAMMAAEAPGGELDENSPQVVGLGCAMLIGGGLALVGVILGIVGLNQQGRKKVFPALGLIINGGMILLLVGLMILGSAMG